MNLKTSMKKKIYLIRANKVNFGGAEIYLERFTNCLKENKYDFHVVNSIFSKKLPSWLRVVLFNAQVCFFKGDKFYFSLERITCPDIYRAGDGVHKRFLEIEKKSKLNLLHPLYLFIEKKVFNKARLIIAISEMVKRDIVNCYGVSPEKIKVIHNGISIEKFNYTNSFNKISGEFNLKRDERVLLFVGSGFKRKGVEEFLKIFSMLGTKKIRAFIVGQDKNITYYEKISKRLNIHEKVVFTGPRKDVKDFFVVSDIFLFPTHYEPFGNVILEAMSYANVVFTTKFCGGGELLTDNFLMENPEDYSIVKQIDDLLNNKNELDSIKKQNFNLSKSYTIEKNVKLTIDAIKNFL